MQESQQPRDQSVLIERECKSLRYKLVSETYEGALILYFLTLDVVGVSGARDLSFLA